MWCDKDWTRFQVRRNWSTGSKFEAWNLVQYELEDMISHTNISLLKVRWIHFDPSKDWINFDPVLGLDQYTSPGIQYYHVCKIKQYDRPIYSCIINEFTIYISCLYFVLTKSIWLIYFLSRDRFYILSIIAHVIFWPPLVTPDEGHLLETSKLFLYFSSSSIPTNESLFILLALPTLALTVKKEEQILKSNSWMSLSKEGRFNVLDFKKSAD
jgi:hypothetical protein